MNDILEIFGNEKISYRARFLISKSLLSERIGIVESMDYRLYVHASTWGNIVENVFTIILTAHGNNVDYFRQSLQSVLNQTTKKLELILVDHGCDLELKKYIYSAFEKDERIKLISFKKNIYDPMASFLDNRISNILNAGLFCSEGAYVYFLSFDDFLSDNYVEAMSALFISNKNCVASSPTVISVNELGEINKDFTDILSKKNNRGLYINGMVLAVSVMNGGDLFASPGGLFAYKTDNVLAYGGLDWANDYSQIFKFGILGDVGTDNQAALYWRHHSNQTNKVNKKEGVNYYIPLKEWINHIHNHYCVNNIAENFQVQFSTYSKNLLREGTNIDINDSIKSGMTGAIKMLQIIIKDLPKIYIYSYVYYLLINMPIMIYNSLPDKYRNLYRKIKNISRVNLI